jgi:hypothetical protein
VTSNNNADRVKLISNWNEYELNLLTRNNWRVSLVPAAAVIPAPICYIKFVAVKKLVVGFRIDKFMTLCLLLIVCTQCQSIFMIKYIFMFFIECGVLCFYLFTLKKLECLKQAFFIYALNSLAWDNKI